MGKSVVVGEKVLSSTKEYGKVRIVEKALFRATDNGCGSIVFNVIWTV
jgi:hypothetical protein